MLPILIAFGHLALWVMIWNRLHALPIPHRWLKVLNKLMMIGAASLPAIQFFEIVMGAGVGGGVAVLAGSSPRQAYGLLCLAAGGWAVIGWCRYQWLTGEPEVLRSRRTVRVNVRARVPNSLIGGRKAACLSWIPANQTFDLQVEHKELCIPSLPASLDGFSIVHLSDLHFTGQIREEYFQVVIDEAIACRADLAVVTGDVIDKVRCLDWIGRTLGRLQAPAGAFYVLGNHDYRLPDVTAVRAAIEANGWTNMAGRWQVLEGTPAPILLAGTEEPWSVSRPDLAAAPPAGPDGIWRILLSHSPDQFPWAKRQGFDLMLAGHTHGGQIRPPGIGPIVAPSLFGARYASGTFHEPPTVLHVSRGISGVDPIRLGCAPELALLVLRQGKDTGQA